MLELDWFYFVARQKEYDPFHRLWSNRHSVKLESLHWDNTHASLIYKVSHRISNRMLCLIRWYLLQSVEFVLNRILNQNEIFCLQLDEFHPKCLIAKMSYQSLPCLLLQPYPPFEKKNLKSSRYCVEMRLQDCHRHLNFNLASKKNLHFQILYLSRFWWLQLSFLYFPRKAPWLLRISAFKKL